MYLNVGLEALLAPWQPPKVRKKVAPSGARLSPPAEIEAVAAKLAEAKNPVILTESAGRDPEAFRALVELAELLAIPVIEPQSAVCANFPKDHPLHLGGDVSLAAGADLVLLVACRVALVPAEQRPRARRAGGRDRRGAAAAAHRLPGAARRHLPGGRCRRNPARTG